VDMIKEDLVAERIAIDSYREIIQYLGDKDPTTKRMLEGILAVEEEHADEIADLREGLPAELRRARPLRRPSSGSTRNGAAFMHSFFEGEASWANTWLAECSGFRCSCW
jgi:hypothetical protein